MLIAAGSFLATLCGCLHASGIVDDAKKIKIGYDYRIAKLPDSRYIWLTPQTAGRIENDVLTVPAAASEGTVNKVGNFNFNVKATSASVVIKIKQTNGQPGKYEQAEAPKLGVTTGTTPFNDYLNGMVKKLVDTLEAEN